MNRILIIDPGKGWGHFVSKFYCYQILAAELNSKIIFFTKKSTQAEHYLKLSPYCEEVIYLDEPKKGINKTLQNIISFKNNIKKINKFSFKKCFVFHPSLRYLLIAKFSKSKEVWGLGLKFQNFFLKKNRKLYSSFFSNTIRNDNETLEFVKKITLNSNFKFKPLYSYNKKLRDTVGIIIAASGFEKRWSIQNYIEIINFLKKKNYRKFLIISGTDQYEDEEMIRKKFNDTEIIFTSGKKIKDIIPYLMKCKFCIGNDTGFAHLSTNLDIQTFMIYGDCPPQLYSDLIYPIDIENNLVRSSNSIHSITADKVKKELTNFFNRRGGRVVEGARLESV
tara:strand:- start:201 stop:1208 length:1008 start_codon:yes stop_codon:yes gene_type:complete